MHICFISDGLYRYLLPQDGQASGGAERQQHMLATRLSRRGHTVSAIVGSKITGVKKVNDIFVTGGCPSSVSSPLTAFSEVQSLYTAIKTTDADMYYVRGAPRLLLAVFALSKVLNKKVVFNVANDSDLDPTYLQHNYNPLFYQFYRYVIQNVDGLITQTHKQRQLLRNHFNQDSIVIPNGYALPDKDNISKHKHRKYVLWVGRSNEQKKKPMRFLELSTLLPEIQFVMIAQPSGDGSHHQEVKENATNIENLRFVGPVSPDEVHDYYNQATLLVNTSDHEGFPNTYLEAWRYRTPVVALYHDIDNIIQDHNLGDVAGSMSNLSNIVKQLHFSPETRKEIGKNARKYVKKHHQIDTIVDQYESALFDVLST